jgi:hypothetical protein
VQGPREQGSKGPSGPRSKTSQGIGRQLSECLRAAAAAGQTDHVAVFKAVQAANESM